MVAVETAVRPATLHITQGGPVGSSRLWQAPDRTNPEDLDGGEVSGEVELLDLNRNVWTVAPNLTVPRSALQAIKVENMYRSFV